MRQPPVNEIQKLIIVDGAWTIIDDRVEQI
jgi:hypothetical protein